jgi:hypothetical protein
MIRVADYRDLPSDDQTVTQRFNGWTNGWHIARVHPG